TGSLERLARPSETVLLVEDDEAVRALAHTVLKRAGYTVVVARNAGEALLLCEQPSAEIDVMVSDVVMPIMGGWQLAQRLRALRPGLKIVLMSGYADQEALPVAARDRHNHDITLLHKPLTPGALLSKIREALAASDVTRSDASSEP